MNILHVLSQVFPSGSEFYACTLADGFLKDNHKVIVVSDTLTAPTNALYIPAPISGRSFLQRVKNIFFLRKLIRQHNIDIVHAHSRASSWVSFFAVKGTAASLISTIHGRQHLHVRKKLINIYGSKIIAICENLRQHLSNELEVSSDTISVVPNGLELQKFEGLKERREKAGEFVLSIIGRTNGPKGKHAANLIKYVLPALLGLFPFLRVRILGGTIQHLGEEALKNIENLNKLYDYRIDATGFESDLPSKILASDLVICSGRIAMESLFLGIPTLAFGEGCYFGMVTSDKLEQAAASNFGDILATHTAPEISYTKIHDDIISYLQNPVPAISMASKIQSLYDARLVSAEVLSIYRSVRINKFLNRNIPVLMYHKIPDQPLPSKHKIYLTKNKFEKHLQFFKKHHFTPITFKDYNDFYEEKKPLHLLPKKPLILTFDDGYKDNYTNMLPLMQQFGFKGVMFLLGNFDITYNSWDADKGEHYDALMTREQKKAFVAAGWEIGAHSMSHADLTQCNDTALFHEISESRASLESELGTKVISFAYPTGTCDKRVKEAVKKNGFLFGIATDTGGVQLEDDRYQVFRISMFPNDSFLQLYKKTAWWYRKYYRFKRGK